MALAFTPIYKSISSEPKSNSLKQYLDSTYTIIGIVACIVAFVGFCGSGAIVSLLAPGFEEKVHDLTVALVKILMITIPITFIVMVGGQQLRSENSFFVAASAAIPLNLILVMSFIFLSPFYGIISVAWMYVAGTIVQLLFVMIMLRKKGYKFKPSLDVHNSGLREIILLTMPILIGNAIQTINTIVDKMLASGLAEGSVSALNFSNKLALFVIGIISVGAGNVCYTKMSELGAKKQYAELTEFLRNIINILNIIVVPATVGMMVLSEPIIKAVFEYGAFDSGSSKMTATALYFYALGLVGYSLRDIITRAYYSIHDSKTPMINGVLAVVINIVLNIVLVQFMGIGGLALATSISAMVGTILLLFSLRRKLGQIGGYEMCCTFLKATLAAGIMGVSVHFGYLWLYSAIENVPVALLVVICIGVVVYSIAVILMKIKEVDFIIGYLQKKIM